MVWFESASNVVFYGLESVYNIGPWRGGGRTRKVTTKLFGLKSFSGFPVSREQPFPPVRPPRPGPFERDRDGGRPEPAFCQAAEGPLGHEQGQLPRGHREGGAAQDCSSTMETREEGSAG